VIPLFTVHVPTAVDKPLLETLHSGYIGQGKKVAEFEAKVASRLGNDKVLSLNSGTSAIVLALRLAGVEQGDEVITTPMTCMATNEPILERGAIPVWADINPATGLIDPLDVERKITSRTKAIIGVDWGGLPCDWEALKTIGKAHGGIPLIEDAAHGFGARYADGLPVGGPSSPDFVIFSFQAIKHITTVDGGLLAVQSAEHYQRGKLLRWYGIDREGSRQDLRCEEDVLEWGYKFHMNDVAATIGLVQLDYLDGILKAHRANANFYRTYIDATGEVFEHQIEKHSLELGRAAFWLYTLLCHDAEDRENFRLYLESKGIMASRVHVRNDIHPVFREFRKELPGVDAFADREIAIPVHWALMESERDRIVEACNSYAVNPARASVPRD
jgi:dTDP-4-amino-4,6-dideoxygalactose transaminase